MKLRYGTRGSALAVAQSDLAVQELKRRNPGVDFERVVIETSGDRFALAAPPDAPVASKADVNVKAMFVKEIEEALLSGAIDFAIHSSKDLPGDLPPGLGIAAYPEREDPRDVFIGGDKAATFERLPEGAKLGTSSLRRRIQLSAARPDLQFTALRGNVDTRLRKLAEGAADAVVLAAAGLKRLARRDVAYEPLSTDLIVPAPGQGALAIEAREDRADVLELLRSVDHEPTRTTVECERAFLKAVGGDCRTPLGAFAKLDGSRLELSVFWSDEDGRAPIRVTAGCDAGAPLERFISETAAKVLR